MLELVMYRLKDQLEFADPDYTESEISVRYTNQ